ncbi:branched-chain amino acid ABC transporter permease [Bradyrhizobium sp. 1]|uniref:branched-chain amino acid ABC transporter permease n=1 Tax=Bradyrhizobium sp. 1 TaxID=241591 RepID=UPI001FFBAD20|nr:branched-chain amino acid ABC transporter permease [Bradyrhizobium sp. 1]MCK1394432.1 branched-chain amino acid ABC transporter permease [Bradyrhizobium sp. 1]
MNSLSVVIELAVSGLVIGCVYALVAWGFTIVFNATGLVNFAAGELVMMGGVISATLHTRFALQPIVTVPLTVIVVAAVSAATDRYFLQKARRQVHMTLVMITIGLAIGLRGAMLFLTGKDFQFPPPFSEFEFPPILGINLSTQGVWVICAVAVMTGVLWWLFAKTWLGYSMRASGENPRAAQLMGVSPRWVSNLSFALAGAMGALAGTLIAPLASANYASGLYFGVKGFSAAVLGGLGSPVGAVVGGLLLGLIESFAAGYVSSGWKDAIALGLLILVLLLMPSGLFGRRATRV